MQGVLAAAPPERRGLRCQKCGCQQAAGTATKQQAFAVGRGLTSSMAAMPAPTMLSPWQP